MQERYYTMEQKQADCMIKANSTKESYIPKKVIIFFKVMEEQKYPALVRLCPDIMFCL